MCIWHWCVHVSQYHGIHDSLTLCIKTDRVPVAKQRCPLVYQCCAIPEIWSDDNDTLSGMRYSILPRYWKCALLSAISVFFIKGWWVTLSANFRWKGSSPINLFWCHETRLITLSCGVKISAACSFLSSQSTRVTDGQTDRIMIPKTALA